MPRPAPALRLRSSLPAVAARWPAGPPGGISPDQSDRLRALLARRAGVRASGRRYLLSGIVTCGRCGQGMYARPHENGTRRYVCVKDPGTAGCGTVTIMAAPADDEIRGRVLTQASGLPAAPPIAQPGPLRGWT